MSVTLFFGGHRMPSQSANRIILLLLLLSLGDVSLFSDCRCNPPKDGESTHWMGNIKTVFIEKKPYQALRGKVGRPDGKPFEGALVEVFTNPEYLLSNKSYSQEKPEQRRVAACRTGADGIFCFRGLASGKYELRSSSDDTHTGWNATQVYVVVDRENGTSKQLRIMMTLGI